MNRGEVERAERRALTILDKWLRLTGCLDGSSYVWEIEGIVKDAVHCGIQEALGAHKPLEAEEDIIDFAVAQMAKTIREEAKPNYWDWWSVPFFEWHVHHNITTGYWAVSRCNRRVCTFIEA